MWELGASAFIVDEYLTFLSCHKITRIMTSVSEFKVLSVEIFFLLCLHFTMLTDHMVPKVSPKVNSEE